MKCQNLRKTWLKKPAVFICAILFIGCGLSLFAQEPEKPYPYRTLGVKFSNSKANVDLAGTLTLPQGAGPFPAVVLVTGSGAQNRDEEILGHRPFLVIADYLTRRGIAVLRYDDRGMGASGGDFGSATTFDFADDAEAALGYLTGLPYIDPLRVGIVGHSEGGIVAAMLASRNSKVSFIVMLAGPGIRGDKLLLLQNAAISRASGMSEAAIAEANKVNSALYAIALEEGDNDALRQKALAVFEQYVDSYPTLDAGQKAAQKKQGPSLVDQLFSPWVRTFLAIDPAAYLREVRIPVLALNGSNDLQVPAEENLFAIRKALEAAGNTTFTLLKLDGLNHLFQHSASGLPAEYGVIGETFAEEALAAMGDWVLSLGRG